MDPPLFRILVFGCEMVPPLRRSHSRSFFAVYDLMVGLLCVRFFLSQASVFFYYFCVPETRGKTLEQISDDLAAEFRLPKDHHAYNT